MTTCFVPRSQYDKGVLLFSNFILMSKNTQLVILGVTALLCSRALFFFFDDPEGPNLLIVVVLAAVLFLLSLAAYRFLLTKMKGLTKLAVAVGVQILAAIVLWFFM
jgi:hypothetical protein